MGSDIPSARLQASLELNIASTSYFSTWTTSPSIRVSFDSTDAFPTMPEAPASHPPELLAPLLPAPRAVFQPELALQRRSKVLESLKRVAKSRQIRSVLDIGCGLDTPMMLSLQECRDDLPIEKLTGVDLDPEIKTVGVLNCFPDSYGLERESIEVESRWREMEVSLLHGSFAGLSRKKIGCYDAITSSEVFEHLPKKLASLFAPVLLGKMQPKVCIITTPNRDFNQIFEMSYSAEDRQVPLVYNPNLPTEILLAHGYMPNRRFRYPGIPYWMRHDDHKFEWTRKEFQDWAQKAAQIYGYNVTFSGSGTMGDGFSMTGDGWDIDGAIRHEIIRLGNGHLLQPDDMDEAFEATFGHCSQIATFVRFWDCQTSPKVPPAPFNISNRLKWEGLDYVTSRIYTPCTSDLYSSFPPTTFQLLKLHEDAIGAFLPADIADTWNKAHCSSKSWQSIRRVVTHTTARRIWESSWQVRRACRFDYNVYLMSGRMVVIDIENILQSNPFDMTEPQSLARRAVFKLQSDNEAENQRRTILLEIFRGSELDGRWTSACAKYLSPEKEEDQHESKAKTKGDVKSDLTSIDSGSEFNFEATPMSITAPKIHSWMTTPLTRPAARQVVRSMESIQTLSEDTVRFECAFRDCLEKCDNINTKHAKTCTTCSTRIDSQTLKTIQFSRRKNYKATSTPEGSVCSRDVDKEYAIEGANCYFYDESGSMVDHCIGIQEWGYDTVPVELRFTRPPASFHFE